MNLSEIQDLIKFVAKSGVSEVELETKDVKIIIKTPASGKVNKQETLSANSIIPNSTIFTPALPAQLSPIAPAANVESRVSETIKDNTSEESKYITIKSPMIGTFYRSPSPDKPSFVNVGDEIKPGKPICIIEAMKLFNEIESDVSGRIVKMLVNDSTPVEYDQALFLVDPM